MDELIVALAKQRRGENLSAWESCLVHAYLAVRGDWERDLEAMFLDRTGQTA